MDQELANEPIAKSHIKFMDLMSGFVALHQLKKRSGQKKTFKIWKESMTQSVIATKLFDDYVTSKDGIENCDSIEQFITWGDEQEQVVKHGLDWYHRFAKAWARTLNSDSSQAKSKTIEDSYAVAQQPQRTFSRRRRRNGNSEGKPTDRKLRNQYG